ncbi:Transmembrane secretion effector [Nonomuraea solani]|uniref:Transmembrane secretion effector n=1 Tax=Nonomuraea solani TaxID=1144553 RepID=A0A1H6EWI5_9ACTN|nr:MFS transporter [Nonomuraea solani]SEH01285.1 Transmembrane secretion effector [Nonomuraea solani]
MWQALRVRDFRYLWVARAVAGLGMSLLVVAIPAQVYAVTGSVLATGVTLAFEHLPSLLLGPYAGVLADRWDRRRLMIATDLVYAAAISVVLFARTPETIWLVYLAALGQGTATVLFRPAAQAHIPAVVGIGPMLTSAGRRGCGCRRRPARRPRRPRRSGPSRRRNRGAGRRPLSRGRPSWP